MVISGLRILLANNSLKSKKLNFNSESYKKIVKYLVKNNVAIYRANPLLFKGKLNPKEYDGVILSGGPNKFWNEKFKFNAKVMKTFRKKPLLGICLGHQFLVQACGGFLYDEGAKLKGFYTVFPTKESKLIAGLEKIRVFKNHRYSAGYIPDELIQTAYSNNCGYEAVRHADRPHFGVQFHPECGGDGHIVLDNFLKICEKNRSLFI